MTSSRFVVGHSWVCATTRCGDYCIVRCARPARERDLAGKKAPTTVVLLPVMLAAMAVAASVAAAQPAPAAWTNITIWHVHPTANPIGSLGNMNSGNSAGDMVSALPVLPLLVLPLLVLPLTRLASLRSQFFASRDRWLPIACDNQSGFRPPGECHMTEVADPAHLAVSQVTVEASPLDGKFRSCNLVQNPDINYPHPTNYSCPGGHPPPPSPPPPCAVTAQPCCGGHSPSSHHHGPSPPGPHCTGRRNEGCKWAAGACVPWTCGNLSTASACGCYTSSRNAVCAPGQRPANVSTEAGCVWDPAGAGKCVADTTTLGHCTVEQFFGAGMDPSAHRCYRPPCPPPPPGPPPPIAPWVWWKQVTTLHDDRSGQILLANYPTNLRG